MHLERLVLQNFRNYQQSKFDFNQNTTLIVGPNTAGKTNLVEAIYYLSFGKSFRTEKDVHLIRFGQDIARVQGLLIDNLSTSSEKNEKTTLEAVLAYGNVTGGRFSKKYLVNNVPKRRIDFEGRMPLVLFSPEELDIVTAGPSLRRQLLDEVLEQTDREYRIARVLYDKALKQRNALLDVAKETGKRDKKQFAYWDELLIANGSVITAKREAFIAFLNEQKKEIFDCTLTYDKSVISEERLAQYADVEIGAGVTLIGPQRDDVLFLINSTDHEIKHFASRGQQRLVVLQIKLLQMLFIKQQTGNIPLLVLDDIFSELDQQNTKHVLQMLDTQQTIITTADETFQKRHPLQNTSVIHLKNRESI